MLAEIMLGFGLKNKRNEVNENCSRFARNRLTPQILCLTLQLLTQSFATLPRLLEILKNN